MDYQTGDIVKFGRHDERIGVVVGIEDTGNGVVLIVKTPQNVIYRQTYDYCTPDMSPRAASVDELVAVATAMRDGIVNRMDEYLSPFVKPCGDRASRIVRVAALAANVVAMLALALAATDMPVVRAVAILAGAASIVIIALVIAAE